MYAWIARVRREEGQALVELALVVPLLLIIIFGIIDFGLAINQYNESTNLSNIAARLASVYTSSSTAPKCPGGTAATSLANYIQCTGATDNSAFSNATVDVCDASSGTAAFTTGDTIDVKVSSTFSWLKLFMNETGGLSTTISSTAYMRAEVTNSTAPSWITTGSTTC